MSRRLLLTLMFLSVIALSQFLAPATAGRYDVEIGIDRLEAENDADYYDRLFIQCGSWLEQYAETKEPAQEKLIELGIPALEHLIPTWLASTNVRHRVTMEAIIRGIGPEAAPVLVPYLTNSNEVMRQRIATNLGRLDAPEALPALVDRLALEREDLVLAALIEAIGRRGEGMAGLVHPLADFVHPLNDERLRRNTAVAYGRIGDPDALLYLVELCGDKLYSVRFPAQESLFKLELSEVSFLWSDVQMGLSDTGKALLFEVAIVKAGSQQALQGLIDANIEAQPGIVKIATIRGLRRLVREQPTWFDPDAVSLDLEGDLILQAAWNEYEREVEKQLAKE